MSTHSNRQSDEKFSQSNPHMEQTCARMSPRLARWVSVVLLVLITSAVYLPIVNQDFADWDDRKILSAIWKPGWERAREIVFDFDLTFSKEVYYSPLHLLSLMMDQALAFSPDRPQPWISKLMNLVIHLANSVLVFAFLLMTGLGRRAAFIASLVFAIHPIQVGTVAWITERKNLLVASCYLGSLIGFLLYLRTGKQRWLPIIVLLLFVGLLSKPLAVTIPVALGMLLLLHPREHTQRVYSLPLALLFLILFSMAVSWGAFVLSTERFHSWILPAWPYRPLLASGAIWFYVSKIVLPVHLVPLYPRWDIAGHVGCFVALFLASLLTIALVICFRNRLNRWILWGLLFFLLNLAPVVGLVPFGYMSHSFVADHFVYLPMLGIALLLGHCIEGAFARIGVDTLYGRLLLIGLYGWLSILGVLAVRQTEVWKNPASIWEATLKVNRNSFAAYNNYGMIRLNKGDYGSALKLFTKAKDLAPKLDKPYHNLGMTYLQMGQRDRARKMFETSVKLNPANVWSSVRLGRMLREDGKPKESIRFLNKAVETNPDSAELRSELGVTLYSQGRIDDALTEFQKAININPLMATPRVHKGIILLSRGDADGAVKEALQALRFSRDARAHNLLGVAHAGKGRLENALREFLQAYTIRPGLPTVRDNVANAYMDLREFAEAREFCSKAGQAGYPCSPVTLKRIQENVGTDALSK